MKKYLLLLSGLLLFFLTGTSYGWSYPVQQVSGNFCGATGGVCSIDLPHIENANYLEYEKSGLYRSIYTVMWGGTYYNGWDFGFGSHQGVDISSTLGTPIYSMGDGEIVEAGERGEWGNIIVIKHRVGSASLWSIYAHLDEILVKAGDEVKEGTLIAKMGSTGNTTGVHVHFQIDTAEGKHPYFPSGCEGSITEIVNEGRCWAQIKANTLDPILFLETNGAIFLAEHKDDLITSRSNYLSANDLNYTLGTTVIKQGGNTSLSITPKNTFSEGAFLKDDLSILTSTGLDASASKIAYLGTGREVSIGGNQAGLHKLTIKSGNSTLKKYTLFVLSESMIATLRKKFPNNEVIQNILNQL